MLSVQGLADQEWWSAGRSGPRIAGSDKEVLGDALSQPQAGLSGKPRESHEGSSLLVDT